MIFHQEMKGVSPSEPDDILILRQLMASVAKNSTVLNDLRKRLMILRMHNDTSLINNGQCVDYVDQAPDPSNNPWIIAIFGLLYLHIFVLGIIGNVAVIYLTFKHRHLQTVQNIFILNLALSDVIVCLLSLPFTPVTNVYKVWYFGSPICHLLPMVQGISVFVSTLSLSAIALDRYNLVVRPHAHPLNSRGASLVAIVLWILSVVVCLPYGWYMEMQTIQGFCGEYCSERWPSEEVRRGYALVVLTTQFLLPFTIMAACYYTIFSVLRERAASKLKKLSERSQLLENSIVAPQDLCSTSPTPQQMEERQRLVVLQQQRRTTTILAGMVLIFGASWLPHNIFTMLMDYDEQIFHHNGVEYTYLVSMITHCTAMLMNVANPFLYAWLNPSFKEMLMKTLRGCRSTRPEFKSDLSINRSGTQSGKNTVIRISSPDKSAYDCAEKSF